MKISHSFFILTGGPGVGKTAVLEELRKMNFQCMDEIARAIIQNEIEIGGDAVPWGNIPAYTRKMLEASVGQYVSCKLKDTICFFDRGIPDTYAYARLTGQKEIEYIRQAVRQYRYNPTVFMFPPWQEIYCTDNERKQDWNEAIKTYEVMKEVYQECGYHLIELPKISVKERTDFILANIHD